MSRENFLSRWSRRKQQVRQGEQSPEATVSLQDELGVPVPPEETVHPEGDLPAGMAEAELSEDEVAALPSIDELTAETDIAPFLRKGVPESLRNAALRRMWSLDPTIRDFVGEAREYAYDWNTPGGVPGSGPLPTSADIIRMVARIVGGETPDPAPSGPNLSTTYSQDREPPSLAHASETDAATPPHHPAPTSIEEPGPRSADQATHSAAVTQNSEVNTAHPGERADVTARRHGGAMPL